MSKVTIRDVAKLAGVGVGTVSRVINGSTAVRPATRARVKRAIERLGYRPNPSAQRLSRGRTHTIGVIAPFLIADSFIHRLRGIESVLRDSEYDLVLFNVNWHQSRDRTFYHLPGPERLDGLIIISIAPTEGEVAQIQSTGLPVVLVDSVHPKLHYVGIDDVAGGELATQHLLFYNHRRIAFVSDFIEPTGGDNSHNASNQDRLAGYQIALAEAGIPATPAYVCQGGRGAQSARRLTQELLSLPEPPTAIFAATDLKAIAVISTAEEMGVSVPDELSVIGYDDVEMAEYVNLTTIRQPLFESGVWGARLLLQLIDSPTPELQQTLLPIELVIRKTTARVPLAAAAESQQPTAPTLYRSHSG